MIALKSNLNSLDEILRDQQAEINKYKWIESERAGRDIGWDRAQQEWMLNHLGDWIHHGREAAIDEALRQACRVPKRRARPSSTGNC